VGVYFAGARTRVGERFADTTGLTFKASGRTNPFLTTRRARVWNFAFPSSSSSALALRSPHSSASAAPPPLAPPGRLRLHRRDVKLDAVQCVPRVGHTPRVLMQGKKKSRRRTPTRIPLYSY
jgi:hypothetical protein